MGRREEEKEQIKIQTQAQFFRLSAWHHFISLEETITFTTIHPSDFEKQGLSYTSYKTTLHLQGTSQECI